MIRIDRIRIVRFRGIVDLELSLAQRNFAVCGPNGTGKSGVVDAIEFALSGDISRLSGKGRGDVSVKDHAPHVDFRNQPDAATVELEGLIVASSKRFRIVRSVADPKHPAITPNDPEVVDALSEIARHKNTTLSRRELIQYILATPGDRAQEINALLQLNQLRDVRSSLQRIANSCERAYSSSRSTSAAAGSSLATALGIAALKIPDLLAAVNQRREVLGLPAVREFGANTSVKDGLSVVTDRTALQISKSVALADVTRLSDEQSELSTSIEIGAAHSVLAELAKLSESRDFKMGLSRHQLLEQALELFDDNHCPVCETEWGTQELIDLIRSRLRALDTHIAAWAKVKKSLEPIIDQLRSTMTALAASLEHGKQLGPNTSLDALASFHRTLNDHLKRIETFADPEQVATSIRASHTVSPEFTHQVDQLRSALEALPETAARDAARDFLVAVEERLDAYRQARRVETKAKQESELAAQVFETYSAAYEAGLNKIYADVQNLFSSLYRSVNEDDESQFQASMAAENAGLGLQVDFYGRGKFPPGAYHSEGHQDGMGLCLYLALMRHLYGEEFRFCVLDDVLMSVDSGHRRAVCKMLAEHFRDVQFIFTTHDEVWLKNMQITGLIGNDDYVLFRNWSVEGGPSEWVSEDIWEEIDKEIDNNRILAAAAALRHYLEYLAGQLCHNLRASVVYRGDNRHSLGDLLPQALSGLRKAIKEGKTAAQSWGNDKAYKELEEYEAAFQKAVADSKAEEWALNAKVHYNEWANLTQGEFRAVANAFKALQPFLQCSQCAGLLYVTLEFGTREALRCGCGHNNHNLKKRS